MSKANNQSETGLSTLKSKVYDLVVSLNNGAGCSLMTCFIAIVVLVTMMIAIVVLWMIIVIMILPWLIIIVVRISNEHTSNNDINSKYWTTIDIDYW